MKVGEESLLLRRRWPRCISGRRGSVADGFEPRIRELLTALPQIPSTVIAERIECGHPVLLQHVRYPSTQSDDRRAARYGNRTGSSRRDSGADGTPNTPRQAPGDR